MGFMIFVVVIVSSGILIIVLDHHLARITQHLARIAQELFKISQEPKK